MSQIPGQLPDQPLPKDGQQDVTPWVITQLQARNRKGIETYGKPLQTMNGRDALWDAFEEALDLAQYLAQVILEREQHRKGGRK